MNAKNDDCAKTAENKQAEPEPARRASHTLCRTSVSRKNQRQCAVGQFPGKPTASVEPTRTALGSKRVPMYRLGQVRYGNLLPSRPVGLSWLKSRTAAECSPRVGRAASRPQGLRRVQSMVRTSSWSCSPRERTTSGRRGTAWRSAHRDCARCPAAAAASCHARQFDKPPFERHSGRQPPPRTCLHKLQRGSNERDRRSAERQPRLRIAHRQQRQSAEHAPGQGYRDEHRQQPGASGERRPSVAIAVGSGAMPNSSAADHGRPNSGGSNGYAANAPSQRAASPAPSGNAAPIEGQARRYRRRPASAMPAALKAGAT